MTPEEIAAEAEANVQRHESDTAFLRTVGQALEAESTRRRTAGEDPLNTESAAALVAALV